MKPRINPAAGKFKYTKGICDNPDVILDYNTIMVKYKLMVCECNAGWLIGFDFIKNQIGGNVIPCSNNGTVYFDKKTASLEVAEIVWQEISDIVFGADIKPLEDLLRSLGSELFLSSTNTKLNMATKKNAPKKGGDKTKTAEVPKGKTHILKASALKKLVNVLSLNDAESLEFNEAKIVDDFCHYTLSIVGGKHNGFGHKVTNKTGIIEDDMRNAFALLNVHLAVIDDVFKHSKINIKKIQDVATHELALLYNVTHYKIQGGEENSSIILIGNKYLASGSRMDLESPKIAMDNLSSYPWYKELKKAADICREEVALYHEGKYTPVKKETDDGAEQLIMNMGDGTDGKTPGEDGMEDAKLK